jgi:drug/metabolite transporter superfamily protein YnfA
MGQPWLKVLNESGSAYPAYGGIYVECPLGQCMFLNFDSSG